MRALDVTGLSCFHGDNPAVENASIAVDPGEIVLVLGPNGAGKSSLLQSIMGVNRRISGRVSVFGQLVNGLPTHLIARAGVAYLPQEASVFDHLTVEENLLSGLLSGDRRTSVDALIREAQERLPASLDLATRRHDLARHLSGGQRRLLSVATVLCSPARVYLLDEPTLGLSAANTRIVMESIQALRKSTGGGFLIVEHKALEALHHCDRVYFMNRGKIIFEETIKDLAATTTTLERLFGIGRDR